MSLPAPKTLSGRIRLAVVASAVVVLSACGSNIPQTAVPVQGPGGPAGTQVADGPLAQELASEVSDSGALVHLQALQKIADENGGNRASPSPGYDASVDYVTRVLRDAGYDVSTPTYEASEDEEHGQAGGTIRNVIAQTSTGSADDVVVIGAHLDSVKEGPGIVDNGSGVATLLEIATRMGASPDVRNSVRFAFFGSEEEGAVGSKAYVEGLSSADRQKIMMYLNVDMVASPNAGYFAQGGKGDDTSETGPAGSAEIAQVLVGQLAKTGVTAEVTEFVGDDESAFVNAGIPSAGAENGDRRKQTDAQARASGGKAGERFDPCYHQACDTLANVNQVVLDHYLHAIAGTVAYYATANGPLAR